MAHFPPKRLNNVDSLIINNRSRNLLVNCVDNTSCSFTDLNVSSLSYFQLVEHFQISFIITQKNVEVVKTDTFQSPPRQMYVRK